MKLLGYLFVLFCAFLVCSGQEVGGDAIIVDVDPVMTDNTTNPDDDNSTTTVPPTTTTVAPTTSAPIAPTTTTIPPTTTTVAPPTPAPSTNTYALNDSVSICVVLQMQLTISVTYNKTDGNVTTGTVSVNNQTDVNNALSSSNCSVGLKNNALNFSLEINGNKDNNLMFQFHREDKKVFVSKIMFSAADVSTLFPDAKKVQLNLENNDKLFETTDTMSFSCMSQTDVKLSDGKGTLTFKDMKVQAFRDKNDISFAAGKDCDADDNVSDIVPIAVGCALAGLVVIVLIAYLVGRRQKRQRGYESV